MHVILRTTGAVLAMSIAVGCSDNDHNRLDAGTTTPGFISANLISDQVGMAANTDPSLVNSWGLTMDAQSFWIANNGSGKVLVVQANGQPSKFSPPSAALNVVMGITGIVANTTSAFQIGTGSNLAPAQMLVASETGQIFAINPSVATTPQLVVDRSSAGAVYKGLAIFASPTGATRLAAADFHNNRIDVFDSSFHLLANVIVADPNLRSGLAPFNIMVNGSNMYVTYAVQDTTAMDDVPGVGNGRLDVFDLNGAFVRTIIDGGLLNAPWGMAIASANFQAGLEGDLIVGNFGDGTLLSVNPNTGVNAQLLTPSQTPLVIPGLWGLAFGNNQVGQANLLYFTAGPSNETHGLFGEIVFGTAPPI